MNLKKIYCLKNNQHTPPRQLVGVGVVLVCLSALAGPSMAHPGHEEEEQPKVKRAADVPPPGESKVTIEMRQGYRYIEANGLPDHDTGRFPGPGNPNAIEAQDYHLRVPITPKLNDKPIVYERQPFGVAINGVLFDPFTAGFWNDDPESGWREAADPNRRNLGLDANHAHVQPNGSYHYHGVPVPLVTDKTRMTLVGWAADGFPIYGPYGYKDPDSTEGEIVMLKPSYQLKSGDRPEDAPSGEYDGTYDEDFEYIEGSGDLDECNGRTGPTPEFPFGTYYYVASNDYPFVPRLFRGEPDSSFDIRGHNGPRNAPQTRPRDGQREGQPDRTRNGQRQGQRDGQRDGMGDEPRNGQRRNRRVAPDTDSPEP